MLQIPAHLSTSCPQPFAHVAPHPELSSCGAATASPPCPTLIRDLLQDRPAQCKMQVQGACSQPVPLKCSNAFLPCSLCQPIMVGFMAYLVFCGGCRPSQAPPLRDPAHMPPPSTPWPFTRAQCLHPRRTGLPQGDTEHREGGEPEAGPCRALSEWAVVLSAQAGDSHLCGCPDTPKGTCANPDAPRTTPRFCQVASQETELRVCPQRQGRGRK